MTGKAIHKRTGRMVTPEEFMRLEGPRYREKGDYPSCPDCGSDLHPYGVNSPNVRSRFDHPDKTDCPLSATPDPRYAHLRPGDWDLEAGKRLRAAFCEPDAIRQGYNVCRALCFEHLRVPEFIRWCRQADHRRVWAYKDLPMAIIPYILVTLADLPPCWDARGGRRFPLRFVLTKPRNEPIDAMWLTPEACSLEAMFADSGRRMAKAPIAIGDPAIERFRSDTGWISDAMVRHLRECCDHSPTSRASSSSRKVSQESP